VIFENGEGEGSYTAQLSSLSCLSYHHLLRWSLLKFTNLRFYSYHSLFISRLNFFFSYKIKALLTQALILKTGQDIELRL